MRFDAKFDYAELLGSRWQGRIYFAFFSLSLFVIAVLNYVVVFWW